MRTLSALLLAATALTAADPKLVAKPEAFTTLVNPDCSHCRDEAKRRQADLTAADPVLLWTRGKYDGGAVPVRFFLAPYRVISDTYGVFVYDPDAGYARGFAASLDFRFHGWRNGVMVMRHKDGTLFSCLSGVAFDGPRKGQRLTPWPTVTTNWGWVTRHYPDAVAYHMFEKYKPVELPATANPDSVATRGEPDKRLAADEVILGVNTYGRARPRAFRLGFGDVKAAVVRDRFECGQTVFVLYQADGNHASAYSAFAEKREASTKLGEEGKPLDQAEVVLEADGHTPAPFRDTKTGSRFDAVGRCVEGELKGWTLRPFDSVRVKWFAWAAEYPHTTISTGSPAPKDPPKADPPAKADPKATIKEIAGTAEFLRNTPKHFATFQGFDARSRTVTLLIDGEKVPKAWPVLPDAEVKVNGWWGRADQLRKGDRVWAWFACDRARNPRAVLMLCDEATEQDIHGKELPKDFAARRAGQAADLAFRWQHEGLPGTVTFAHVAGEVELTLDHEAMRWARSLKPGDTVEAEDPSQPRPPAGRVNPLELGVRSRPVEWDIAVAKRQALAESLAGVSRVKAVVKDVRPWRERTRLTLVVNGLNIAPFESGVRTFVKMPPPSKEVQDGDYPPDIGLKRTTDERVEWFLASIYCTCKVGNDICTGDFYTLASCNPNGCGMPNATRRKIAAMIDKGMTDREIWDDLRAERGPLMARPHLRP